MLFVLDFRIGLALHCHAFGPLAMLLLSAWSTNGWLPSGHAMRMALDLGLHHALEKLADGGSKRRTEEEERHLGVFIIHVSFVLRASLAAFSDAFDSGVSKDMALSLLVRPSVRHSCLYTFIRTHTCPLVLG